MSFIHISKIKARTENKRQKPYICPKENTNIVPKESANIFPKENANKRAAARRLPPHAANEHVEESAVGFAPGVFERQLLDESLRAAGQRLR